MAETPVSNAAKVFLENIHRPQIPDYNLELNRSEAKTATPNWGVITIPSPNYQLLLYSCVDAEIVGINPYLPSRDVIMFVSDSLPEELLSSIYDAAIFPELWSKVCDGLSSWSGAVGTVLIPDRRELRKFGLPQSDSLTELITVYVKEGWYLTDLRERGYRVTDTEGVMLEHDFVTSEEMARSPYYEEFLRPCGLRWFAGLRFSVHGQLWTAAIQRSPQQGPYDEGDRLLLGEANSHLSRAATLASSLAYAHAQGVVYAFERMAVGAIALDRAGSVLLINSTAQKLIGAGIDITRNRIRTSDHASSQALDALIEVSVRERAFNRTRPQSAVVIPRPAKGFLVATVFPLAAMGSDAFGGAKAIVLISNSRDRRKPSVEILRSLYGLTATEARFAEKLAAGVPIREIADDLGLTRETARSYAKSILGKTDTHKQTQLIALLASIAVLTHE